MTLQNLSAYGFAFQTKVVSGLLSDKEFLQSVHDIIQVDTFDNAAHKWIVEQILSYYDKYNTTPTMEVMKIEMKRVENEVLQLSIKEQLREAYKSTQDDLHYIQQEFSTFCKNQQLKQALLSSVDLLHAGDYESIRYLVDKALKSGQDKSLGHEYAKDIESRYREDNRVAIPTPWAHINELLQGGIGSGDFGLIFGNPGGGKCLGPDSTIEIEYPEYGIEVVGRTGTKHVIWITPWDEFNFDGVHMFGWQIAKVLS